MPARYHPISSTLWSDVRLEGLRFEAKAFFCYLCSNDHLRPSGIYRVTDKQLAGETDLSVRTVQAYCQELAKRSLIVRDGSWLFVRKYLKRQPKTDWLLRGVERDILDCDSSPVLMEFGECYPHLYRWSADRLEKVARRSPDLCIYTEQNRAEQSRADKEREKETTLSSWHSTAQQILQFLNEKAGKSFRSVPAHLELIQARLKDGATEANCRGVIARKVREWGPDPKMAKYLRPETLFNRTKFESYLGERGHEEGA
jgi:uncharacterized phage protein (TIGR02220 family)